MHHTSVALRAHDQGNLISPRNLTLSECALLALALPLVVVVRLGLWVLPSRLILRFVRHLESAISRETEASVMPARTILWSVEAASRRVPRASCLTQAIAAKLLLRAFGRDARLCLGVARTNEGTLRAHAWLEREGSAVLGGAGTQTLVRLPDLRAADVPSLLTR